MAINASEEQKQLIEIAKMLGIELLATGGEFTDSQVTDDSVLTLFDRLGTEYTYSIGKEKYLDDILIGDNSAVLASETGNILMAG